MFYHIEVKLGRKRGFQADFKPASKALIPTELVHNEIRVSEPGQSYPEWKKHRPQAPYLPQK